MTPNEAFVAGLATLVLTMLALIPLGKLIDRWERREREKAKP